MADDVRFDERSLLIGSRRVHLISGAFHYFRVPAAEWRDRLEKSARGGLNTIETIVPWNVHEDVEGRFDFDGDHDLEAFLTLCAELGLYAFVRPSPYICGEWDNGGLPAWLQRKSDVAYRRSNAVYLAHLARWYDALIPRIARHQVTRGGSVILVQIENEYGYFRDAQDRSYLEFLRDALRGRGIEVPLTTCDWPGKGMILPGVLQGGNCGSGFREAIAALRQAQPEAFPFISELWLAWFDAWGGEHHRRRGRTVAMALKEVLASGGQYNFYMWAGGTNPGYTAGRTTTGDYGAFITTSYDYDAPIGETGDLTPKFYECRLVNTLVQTCNPLFAGSVPVQSPWAPSDPSVVFDARRAEGGTVLYLQNTGGTPVACHLRDGARRFPRGFDWVIPAGETIIVLEDLALGPDIPPLRASAEALGRAGLRLLLYGEPGALCEVEVGSEMATGTFPADGAGVLAVGGVEVVLLSRQIAQVTWISDGTWRIDPGYGVRAATVPLPRLRWEAADVLDAPRSGCAVFGLLSLERAGVMHGYGWYRTTFVHPGGRASVVLGGVHDRATVFVNGQRQGVVGAFASFAHLEIEAQPGTNELRILLDPLGRYTFTSRIGESKGLLGPAYLGGRPDDLSPWITEGDRRIVPLPWGEGQGLLVRLAGFDGRPATVGIDGTVLHHHRGTGDDDTWMEADLTPYLRPEGNILWVEGGASEIRMRAVRTTLAAELSGPWEISGGVLGEPGDEHIDPRIFDALPWEPWAEASPDRPRVFRARFNLDLPPDAMAVHLVTAGLSKGVAWINGHHLGRFWDLGPQRALVIPRPWLGLCNELVVFDEEGRSPLGVTLVQRAGVLVGD